MEIRSTDMTPAISDRNRDSRSCDIEEASSSSVLLFGKGHRGCSAQSSDSFSSPQQQLPDMTMSETSGGAESSDAAAAGMEISDRSLTIVMPTKPDSKTSLSSGTVTEGFNNSNNEEMSLSPITANGSALNASYRGSGVTAAVFHESWQTGATRKKRNISNAATSKWKDPLSDSFASSSPSAASPGVGRVKPTTPKHLGKQKKKSKSLQSPSIRRSVSRTRPLVRSTSGGDPLHLKESNHSNNNSTSAGGSSSSGQEESLRTMFRRTASVPVDIASMSSGQRQFPGSTGGGRKKINVQELAALHKEASSSKLQLHDSSRVGLSMDGDNSENHDPISSPTAATSSAIASPPATDVTPTEIEQDLSRRSQFRRSTSVPHKIGLADLAASRPTTPIAAAITVATPNQASKDLTEFLVSGDAQAPLLMNEHSHSGGGDGNDTDDDGDSTIEESWRPVPEKRKILSEAADVSSGVPPTPSSHTSQKTGVTSNKTSLDNFLDALIFDAKKSTADDPDQHSLGRRSHSERRRRHKGSHHSSSQSVGSFLDKPTIFIQGGPGDAEQEKHETASVGNARTPGTLWSRRGMKKPRGERIRSKASLMSSASSMISSTGSSTGMESGLSAFLERESRHGRPTEAHSVSGDRVASGAISIVLSEDGQSKTYTVGAREAKLVEKLLQATNDVSSKTPGKKQITSTRSMKGWLEQVAGNLKSPSGHSEIQNSARVSTRSSLAVELSPPLADDSLKSYLEAKRGRRKGGAFTVAGDRVSTRFKGKSTQEMLQMLDVDRARSGKEKMPTAPPLASEGGAAPLPVRRHKSHTGEMHSRLPPFVNTGELANLKYSGGLPPSDLHNSMPAINFDLDADIEGSDRVVDRSYEVPVSPQAFDDRIDTRMSSGNDRRRARSTTPTKGRVMHDGKNQKRATSNPKPRGGYGRPRTPTGSRQKERLGDSLNFKDVDLKDFRPPSSTRPTNRRTMMRKMHSVPVMSNSNFDADEVEEHSSGAGKKPNKRSSSKTKKKRKSRSNSESSQSSHSSRGSRGSVSKSKKKSSSLLSSSLHGTPVTAVKEEDREMEVDELGNKSFLDRFLDGDVDAHDSASYLNGPESPRKLKDEYKASLVENAPVENSVSKLRIEPDFLDGSNRIILQDPGKAGSSRRDMMGKKQRSNPNLNASSALKDLYDSPKATAEGKPKVDQAIADGAGGSGNGGVLQSPQPEHEDGDEGAGKSAKKKGPKTKSGKKKKSKSVPSGTLKTTADDELKKSKAAKNDDEMKSPNTHSKKSKAADSNSKEEDELASPSNHSLKSPTKKKKTPKSKKGKLLKDGKKKKGPRSSSARRSKDKDRAVITDDEEEKKVRRSTGSDKSGAKALPQLGLQRSVSCPRLDIGDMSVDGSTDRLLQERITALAHDSPPPTPNSERAVMGDKPLRKGRKPKHPNQPTPMTVEPDEDTKLGRWKSPMRDESPRRSPRRGEREQEDLPMLPNIPFMASTERSASDQMPESERCLSPSPAVQKKPAILNSQGLKSALKSSDAILSPQQSPRRYSRPIPTVGRENTVLEVVHDDDSVMSDITDQFFDITEEDIGRSKVKSTNHLERIEEPEDDDEEGSGQKRRASAGSWAELSHSLKPKPFVGGTSDAPPSRGMGAHNSRRWHSMKDLGSSRTAPKTPVRGTKDMDDIAEEETQNETKTPTRLGWLKKRFGLKKKK